MDTKDTFDSDSTFGALLSKGIFDSNNTFSALHSKPYIELSEEERAKNEAWYEFWDEEEALMIGTEILRKEFEKKWEEEHENR